MPLLALHAIFGVVLLCIAGFGCGFWIAPLLPASFVRAERTIYRLLGGLSLLSLVLFLIGQIWFTRPIIFSGVVAAALLGIRPTLQIFSKLNAPNDFRPKPLLPAAIVIAVLLLTAVAGLAQITGDWNNDSVAYHLLGPRVWLREGIIRPVPDNDDTAFPAIAETHFAALYAIGGDRAPDFFSFVTLGLLLAVAAGVGARLGLTSRQAWWAAAIIATMPAVYAGSHGCFIDGFYAALVLAAVRVALDASRLRESVICGVFCGLALGVKYTALLAVPTVLVCFASALYSKEFSLTEAAKNIAAALAIAALLAAPFYLRNWLLLGCPIYPPPPTHIFACVPKYLSPQILDAFHDYIRQRGTGLGRGWLAFAKLPFNLTYHTANFHGGGGIGLCPLGLAPFGVVALRKNIFAKLLLACGALLISLWFVTQQESRFLIHVYAISAIFSVAGWGYIVQINAKLPRLLAAAVVAVSVAYGSLMIERSQAEKLHATFSPAFASRRSALEIPYSASFEFLNNDPSVKKILLLDQTVPPFYSQKPYIKPIGMWGERTLDGVPASLDALPIAHQLGITHVLDVVSPLSNFQISSSQPGLALVFESANQRVYEVQ
jgi:hypothetical protein